jgi:hypothetical protein
LGWAVSNTMWDRRNRPLYESYGKTLEFRPMIDSVVWGDEIRQEIARIVCESSRINIGWPNDRFIPGDPIRIAFWSFHDGLDATEALKQLEEHFTIKFMDDAFAHHWNRTVGDLVELIASLTQAEEPESSPASPLPS